MSRKKPRAKPKPKPKPKPKSCGGKCTPKPKPKPKPKPTTAKRQPPPKMLIRNNRNPAPEPEPEPSHDDDNGDDTDARTPIVKRVSEMGGSHLLTGIGAGVVGQVIAVATVGKALAGPKTTAGVVMGVGGVTTGAGWILEMDHVMAAGVGLTTAGALSMTNQLAADAYDSMEKRAEEKRAKKKAEEDKQRHVKALADARALLEAENKKHRNARHIAIIDPDAARDADADDAEDDTDDADYPAVA